MTSAGIYFVGRTVFILRLVAHSHQVLHRKGRIITEIVDGGNFDQVKKVWQFQDLAALLVCLSLRELLSHVCIWRYRARDDELFLF